MKDLSGGKKVRLHFWLIYSRLAWTSSIELVLKLTAYIKQHWGLIYLSFSWKAWILFILTTLWCFFVTNKKQIKRNRERFGDFWGKAGLDSTRSLLHHPFLYYCLDCVYELSMIKFFFFSMKYASNFSILCEVHWIIQSIFSFKV